MDISTPQFMDYFLQFSVEVTGFSQFALQGTGQAELYFETVRNAVGDETFGELLQLFNDQGLDQVLASATLEPIARNIIKLWFIATWDPVPPETEETHPPFIPAPTAYPEGLVWSTIGVNPPAAKAAGYATWSDPPLVKLAK